MVPTPQYVKGMRVSNTTSHKLKLTAHYGGEDMPNVTDTQELDPHQSLVFPEKIVNMENMQLVNPVIALEVESLTGGLSTYRYEPSVKTIVNELHVKVGADDSQNALQVTPHEEQQ